MAAPIPDCPINQCQRLLGGKWCLVIIWNLRQGSLRFNALERAIGTVSHKALAETLRNLERDGLLTRQVHPTVPPQVDYSLSPLGLTLLPIIAQLENWGASHAKELPRAAG